MYYLTYQSDHENIIQIRLRSAQKIFTHIIYKFPPLNTEQDKTYNKVHFLNLIIVLLMSQNMLYF